MISAIDIGLAREGEAVAVALLSREIVEYGLRWSWTPERVRRRIASRSTNVIVAREGKSVVGFALMEYGEDKAHLVLLGVSPMQRRRGIATALMQWLEATLRTAGIATMLVEVRESNHGARAFYAKLGFTQAAIAFGYYQNVENAVQLRKSLAPQSEDR